MKRTQRVTRFGLVTALLAGPLLAQTAPAPAVSPADAQQEVKEFTAAVTEALSTFNAMSSLVGLAEKAQAADENTAARAAESSDLTEPAESATVQASKHRPIRNTVALVAAGAGLGAGLGKATGKKQGPLVGAIAGGIAGLIYDRMTYKNPKGF